MNKTRRQKIAKIAEQLEFIKSELDCIRDEEQEAYDCMPENLQDSERGCKLQEAVDNLSDAIDGLDNIFENLNEVII